MFQDTETGVVRTDGLALRCLAAARTLTTLLVTVAVVVLLPSPPAAQTGSSFNGRVTDGMGGVLPGVTVEAASPALRGGSRVTTTDGQGRYRIIGLLPGAYTLTFSLPGFSRVVYDSLKLGGDSTRRVDVEMRVGGVEESVTVSGESSIAPAAGHTPAQRVRNLRRAADRTPGWWNELSTEAYDPISENGFRRVTDHPLSTFAIDVDTASYAIVRRFLHGGTLPPADSVRVEELINYFSYDYPQPDSTVPFSVTLETAASPWAPDHQLVMVGLKGREVSTDARPRSNLVFLLDVSGSMQAPNKLPLVKRSLTMLASRLRSDDRVSIVVYAGASGVVLPSTPGSRRRDIVAALDRLHAGGSTNGGAGIKRAYDLAAASFVEGGINRVILATDGDFNVGITDQASLVRLIETEAARGIYLSVLGFGMGNYKDSTLEKLADTGNGHYAYIDTGREARKVLVEEATSTLFTIAKDVKIQIEFNPATVGAYRLIGYENRLLADEDFNDDTTDAGEIGAGHTVTALYEIVPVGVLVPRPSVDPLKYQVPTVATEVTGSDELLTVKLRYKEPDSDVSRLLQLVLPGDGATDAGSTSLTFASAVACAGMLLTDSPHKGDADWTLCRELAVAGKGGDESGYRAEFIGLVELASDLHEDASLLAEARE